MAASKGRLISPDDDFQAPGSAKKPKPVQCSFTSSDNSTIQKRSSKKKSVKLGLMTLDDSSADNSENVLPVRKKSSKSKESNSKVRKKPSKKKESVKAKLMKITLSSDESDSAAPKQTPVVAASLKKSLLTPSRTNLSIGDRDASLLQFDETIVRSPRHARQQARLSTMSNMSCLEPLAESTTLDISPPISDSYLSRPVFQDVVHASSSSISSVGSTRQLGTQQQKLSAASPRLRLHLTPSQRSVPSTGSARRNDPRPEVVSGSSDDEQQKTVIVTETAQHKTAGPKAAARSGSSSSSQAPGTGGSSFSKQRSHRSHKGKKTKSRPALFVPTWSSDDDAAKGTMTPPGKWRGDVSMLINECLTVLEHSGKQLAAEAYVSDSLSSVAMETATALVPETDSNKTVADSEVGFVAETQQPGTYEARRVSTTTVVADSQPGAPGAPVTVVAESDDSAMEADDSSCLPLTQIPRRAAVTTIADSSTVSSVAADNATTMFIKARSKFVADSSLGYVESTTSSLAGHHGNDELSVVEASQNLSQMVMQQSVVRPEPSSLLHAPSSSSAPIILDPAQLDDPDYLQSQIDALSQRLKRVLQARQGGNSQNTTSMTPAAVTSRPLTPTVTSTTPAVTSKATRLYPRLSMSPPGATSELQDDKNKQCPLSGGGVVPPRSGGLYPNLPKLAVALAEHLEASSSSTPSSFCLRAPPGGGEDTDTDTMSTPDTDTFGDLPDEKESSNDGLSMQVSLSQPSPHSGSPATQADSQQQPSTPSVREISLQCSMSSDPSELTGSSDMASAPGAAADEDVMYRTAVGDGVDPLMTDDDSEDAASGDQATGNSQQMYREKERESLLTSDEDQDQDLVSDDQPISQDDEFGHKVGDSDILEDGQKKGNNSLFTDDEDSPRAAASKSPQLPFVAENLESRQRVQKILGRRSQVYFVPARLHHLNSADEESSTDDEGKQADKSPDEENGDTQDAAGEQQPAGLPSESVAASWRDRVDLWKTKANDAEKEPAAAERPQRSGGAGLRAVLLSESDSEDDELEKFLDNQKSASRLVKGPKKSTAAELAKFVVDDDDVTSGSDPDDSVFYRNTDLGLVTPRNEKRGKNRGGQLQAPHTVAPASRPPRISPPRPSPPRGGDAGVFRTPAAPTVRPRPHTTGHQPESACFLASLSLVMDAGKKRHLEAQRYVSEFSRRREELTQKLFTLYNETVFDNQLPPNMVVKWNGRLLKTAGFCAYKRSQAGNESQRSVRIELSTKVCDSPERVRDTLIHEMCHAAVWIVYGVNDGHGPYWKHWAKKANRIHKSLPVIRRCHSYDIQTKYTYKCTSCGYEIGRHSKSLDTDKKVCGYCKAPFQCLVNTKSSSSGSGVATPVTPRTPNKFAVFVKENYRSVKAESGATTHKDVMNKLSEAFNRAKITGAAATKK